MCREIDEGKELHQGASDQDLPEDYKAGVCYRQEAKVRSKCEETQEERILAMAKKKAADDSKKVAGDSKVERCVKEVMKTKGYSFEKALKVCQASTGQALKTGKKAKSTKGEKKEEKKTKKY
jgi:tRNA G10  N-methylase Trm11